MGDTFIISLYAIITFTRRKLKAGGDFPSFYNLDYTMTKARTVLKLIDQVNYQANVLLLDL